MNIIQLLSVVPTAVNIFLFTAAEFNVRNFVTIFPVACLRQMAEITPSTVDQMVKEIDNMPRAKVTKYKADRFLDITRNYKFMIESMFFFRIILYTYSVKSHIIT